MAAADMSVMGDLRRALSRLAGGNLGYNEASPKPRTRKTAMSRLPIVILAALLAMPLQAQDKQTSNAQPPSAATEKMNEALDQPTPVEDGAKQPPGGKAEPEENWFGCKPDPKEQQEKCDELDSPHKGQETPRD
jgi:hypothetical protein